MTTYYQTENKLLNLLCMWHVGEYMLWHMVFQKDPLGFLIFNIHLWDLFSYLKDFVIASYVDDTTIYIINEKEVVSALETSSSLLFEWFDSKL